MRANEGRPFFSGNGSPRSLSPAGRLNAVGAEEVGIKSAPRSPQQGTRSESPAAGSPCPGIFLVGHLQASNADHLPTWLPQLPASPFSEIFLAQYYPPEFCNGSHRGARQVFHPCRPPPGTHRGWGGGWGAGGPWAMRDCLHTRRSHYANGRRRGVALGADGVSQPIMGRPPAER